ncbi:MAG: glycosyltransferase family 2 protein [Clostridia bacterium]|jgi:cellulose synthase/poly-beta-1,6-N-acetylglucosamine synthase-like glycosyltransferase
MINDVVYFLSLFAQVLLWVVFIYYFAVSAFGWFKRKEISADQFPVENKFIVFIAAHNEEKVIGNIIRNLKTINYPKDMYDICVIADNCDDSTAKVAIDNGANVLERKNPAEKGKGFCLEWAFRNLFESGKEYDAVCILDADNLVSDNFLLEMNKQLSKGNKVVQGYLDSKNPNDSWVSGNNSITFWISDRLFQLPRYYLGLSCFLCGTGFVIKTDLLKSIGWQATCLTEDLEFSLRLILKGMRVAWSHEAIVYDEKPLQLKQSWKQRKRWMQGHFDCATRFLKPLITKAVKEKDRVSFDAVMYLIQPFVIVANGIALVTGSAIFIRNRTQFVQNSNILMFILLMLIFTYYTVTFVIAEGKMTAKILKYFILFPLYNLTWVPIILQGFIHRNENEWVHTKHVRDLDIDDMKEVLAEKLEKAR